MAEADPALPVTRKSKDTVPPAPTPLAQVSGEDATSEREGSKWRRRALMISVPLLIIAGAAGFWFATHNEVTTDNAYVQQDIVSVSADVSGKIIEVKVKENQQVKAGDLLFRIDPEPYRVALAQADAAIAAAQVNVGELRAKVGTSDVDILKARKDIAFAQSDYARQSQLAQKGFTTRARLDEARHGLDVALASLKAAQASAAESRSALATGGQVPGVNPQLAAAQAQRAKAALDLRRTEVRAPASGRVSQTSKLLVGQMMVTGLPAVSIVSNDRSWVEANFKETQLRRIRVGQPATLSFDAFGVKLKGHIASIGGGTGSEFSVLPAQNANGNWVKITQRVPVRIAIDEASPRQLIAGLSSEVTVDVSE